MAQCGGAQCRETEGGGAVRASFEDLSPKWSRGAEFGWKETRRHGERPLWRDRVLHTESPQLLSCLPVLIPLHISRDFPEPLQGWTRTLPDESGGELPCPPGDRRRGRAPSSSSPWSQGAFLPEHLGSPSKASQAAGPLLQLLPLRIAGCHAALGSWQTDFILFFLIA